ncbi:glycoside hydrolase family 2 protein [Asticcacaulis solisilvae]|uniref:glycoside hydrolase family 2 protein n=1 Tax=Asticcacaulis solisilvae TaxID=1217274 RepID=UPI003FD8999D
MKFIAMAASAAVLAWTGAASAETRTLDAGWLFAKGDIAGAETPAFIDSAWQRIDLPHDWEIAGPFDQTAPATGSGAWLPTGVAWYRKHLALSPSDAGKRIFIEFDGVMERSGVWINGMHLGYRPSGYASFRYELTPFLKAGDNVISVRADTSSQPASRWYAGGGIYRHVRLMTTGDIHADTYGNAVTTQVGAGTAAVHIESSVVNQGKADRTAHLEVEVVGPDGKTLTTIKAGALALPAGRTTTLTADGTLVNPRLWSLDDPALNTARIKVVADNGEVLDDNTVTFGVRDMQFKADSGFWLNGRNIKLKGVAIHADGGAFGMAVPLDVYARRLATLKSLGVNAIRTAHHPFSPEFLDLCDRMGFVVMGEAFDQWTVAKNPQDYHLFFTDWSSMDARDFVRRDRNHPSIAIWSMGNEIHDTPYPLVAKSIIARLKDVFHAEDPSRPVTMALFRPNTTHDYDNGLADMLDVVGQNYRETELAKAHADKPERKIIGTENSKNRDSWLVVRDNPAYAGMFLWTGADYLGEADRAGWPFISNPSGLIDRDDVIKPIGAERASWWSDAPVIAIARRVTAVIDTSELPTMTGVAMPQPKGPGVLADWTPDNLSPHTEKVEIYSNAPQAELFLNGKSLGKKPRNADDSARTWDVAFAPGTVKAVGYDASGKAISETTLQTAGAPAAIRLTAESKTLQPGFDHIGFVRAEVVDAKGVVVPNAAVPLSIKVSGAGSLAAADNGSPTDHTAFASPERTTWQGHALIMVRATRTSGAITVDASAPGLKAGAATLTAKP